MFVRRKRNRSGTTSVVVVEKRSGSFKECITMGVSDDANQIEEYVRQGKEWIRHRSGIPDIFADAEGRERASPFATQRTTSLQDNGHETAQTH